MIYWAANRLTRPILQKSTYAQAMNLQTNIYTAVLAFGLAQSIMANGAFMIATGIAFIVVGDCALQTG